MTTRRTKLTLSEAHSLADLEALTTLASATSADTTDECAVTTASLARLASLLDDDRRVWTLGVDSDVAGFLDAARDGDTVTLSAYVDPAFRRRGIASGAIGRVLGTAPWPDTQEYVACVDRLDIAGREMLRSVGFRFDGLDDAGHLVWRRAAPRARNTGPERFLDGDGRIDRYPLRSSERHALLTWVADRTLPRGEVWTERQVNERLADIAPAGDVAVLRRYLVDAELLERTRSGSSYARVDESDA